MADDFWCSLFGKSPLMAVIRQPHVEDALWVAEALIEAGIRTLEVTWTTPRAYQLLHCLSQDHPEVAVGAGTVLTEADACRAYEAGARFIVSPGLSEILVQWSQRHSLPYCPGVLTPSEVMRAAELGCKTLKLFPAKHVGGVSYLQALAAPFPNVRFIPTGGVTWQCARSYLEAGALAVGTGRDLAPAKIVQHRDKSSILQRARFYLEACRDYHSAPCVTGLFPAE